MWWESENTKALRRLTESVDSNTSWVRALNAKIEDLIRALGSSDVGKIKEMTRKLDTATDKLQDALSKASPKP